MIRETEYEPRAGRLGTRSISSLLPASSQVDDPTVRAMLERSEDPTSRPGARNDDNQIYLAIEGGGMGGTISAGMCIALESFGLTRTFDRIYGCSAGALNGSATAAGQAALGSTNYQDTANSRFASKWRLLRGKPVIDFDFLFDYIIDQRKPLSEEGLGIGPEFRALAVSLEDKSLRVLSDFTSTADLLQAVRVSSSLPVLGGDPVSFRGERMIDGGVIQSIPFESAIDEGGTHVMVLRSRHASYRKKRYSKLAGVLVKRQDPVIWDLVEARPYLYNEEADKLEGLDGTYADSFVTQITIPEGTPLVSQITTSQESISQGLRSGAAAMSKALIPEESIDLIWQPVTYQLEPAG